MNGIVQLFLKLNSEFRERQDLKFADKVIFAYLVKKGKFVGLSELGREFAGYKGDLARIAKRLVKEGLVTRKTENRRVFLKSEISREYVFNFYDEVNL